MACGLKSILNYPDYLQSILKEINIGNDTDLKACACSLKSYIDVNSKPYSLPICISSVNGEDNEIYTILNNYIISQGGTTTLQAIDPQRIMELQYKYKSFTSNILGNGYEPSITCDGEEPVSESFNFSGNIKYNKSDESAKHQVCNMFQFNGACLTNGNIGCEDNPPEWVGWGANIPAFGFHYYFFMDTYVDPECGEPGPILYQFLWYYAGYKYIPVNDYYFQTQNPPSTPNTQGYGDINTTNLIAW
jgi:hypothetical protein